MLDKNLIRLAAKAALTQSTIDQSKDIDCDCLLEFGFNKGFEAGYILALEQIKQKPLYIYTIYTQEGIEASYKEEQGAKDCIERLKKDHPKTSFWYEKELIK